MAKIAVLGLGAMGSRMALNLLKAGHSVTVWNRTSQAAVALVTAGVHQAPSPKVAAVGADFVIAMVRDEMASRNVWLDPESGAFAGMCAGAVAIESSTLTPHYVRLLGEEAAAHGVSLLEAPVSGSRPQAEAGQLIYFVGGDLPTFQRSEPLLRVMGSTIRFVGPLGAGSLVKLTTNTLLGVQVTVLAELIGMLRRSGIDVVQALEAVAATAVWSTAAQRIATSMVDGDFAAQFPVELIEKDFGYTLEVVGSSEAAPTIAAARGVFSDAISQGMGKVNMTGVVRMFCEPPFA
ncbi:NAD(P)-dependent oxidoreductase [Cupriavidus necator]